MAYGFFSDIGAGMRSIWDPGYYSGEYMERKSSYQLAKKGLRKSHRTERIKTRQKGRTGRTKATGKRAVGSATPLIGAGLLAGAGIAGAAGLKGPWAAIAQAAGGLTAEQTAMMNAGLPPPPPPVSPILLMGGAVLLGGLVYVATKDN